MKTLGIVIFVILMATGAILNGMGNLEGVCISCAYEHGYGWQIEQANNFMYAGIIVIILAFAVLILTIKDSFTTQQQTEKLKE